MKQKNPQKQYIIRFYFLIGVFFLCFFALIWRVFYLNILRRNFLQHQSDIRAVRVVDIPAHRGMILDRNGKPLAISSAVDSVWINPQILIASNEQLVKLAHLLNVPYDLIKRRDSKTTRRSFVYLRRHINPNLKEKIKALNISGLFFQREYQRFYPSAEVFAHVLGFTNIDDRGQEGLELAYDSWLYGVPGKRRVLKDRLGHIIANLEVIKQPQPGHNLVLSLDSRIQYLAYRVLKSVVNKYHAASGSVVVLDVKTGEILAMVNQPSYNPNDRHANLDSSYRNRAVTDVFEPGSTMKAFSITSALESGKYTPDTKIDTNPGWMVIDGNTINDEHINHGVLTVTGVLQKSSNVGVAKMTLSLPPEHLWAVLHGFGFGERTASGFPGEASGSLINRRIWRPFVLATLAFGYAISVTPLQLACAYAVIAADGLRRPVTFLKLAPAQVPAGTRVIGTKVAHEMLKMLQSVVHPGGTGTQAQISGYTVAGKTGTANIADKHGYNKKAYTASFVGIAPVTRPRLVVAVVLRKPQGSHYGGLVAAPAFAKIMSGALRIMDVVPDKVSK